MTINCNFFNNGKDILNAYQNDRLLFKHLKSSGYEASNRSIIECIQEIFKADNFKAMQALIEAGLALNDDDNQKIANGIFVSPLAKISTQNYLDLRKSLTHAHQQVNFYQNLELLIFKFNYQLNLNELFFLINDFSCQGRIISQDLYAWFEMVNECTNKSERLGHVLGLSGNICVPFSVSKNKYTARAKMNFEGSYDIRSYNILINKLSEYRNTLGPHSALVSDFDKIIHSFQFMCHLLKGRSGYYSHAPKNLFERYQNAQLTNITAGWEKHSICITLYNGYLILSNRGENGDQALGTKIYQIKPGGITEKWIKQILDKSLNGQQLNDFLSLIIDFAHPVAVFPNKGQKHGNCSYANILSSTEAQLCLMEAQRRNMFTSEGISRIAEQMTNTLTRNHGVYKKFTAFNRNTEINNLIKDMKERNSINSDFSAFYYELFKAIITQHHGKTKNPVKKDNEITMVRQLFETLSKNEQLKLLVHFQIKDISDLFQPKQRFIILEEEYFEETLSMVVEEHFEETLLLPKHKVSPSLNEEDNLQNIIDSLNKIDIEIEEIETLILKKTNPICFSTYFDTLKKIGAKTKTIKDIKNVMEEKHNRYDRTI